MATTLKKFCLLIPKSQISRKKFSISSLDNDYTNQFCCKVYLEVAKAEMSENIQQFHSLLQYKP